MSNETEIVNGVHDYTEEEKYILPPSPIREKLEWFKDLKFALMVHWGLYNQLGIIPSWGMVDNQAHWSRSPEEFGPGANWTDDANKLRREYSDLINSFNPIRFNPDDWADFAKENCFQYLIFTTKHHDGFCMWDTKQTDYKVTSEKCPFHTHEKADIVKEIFDSFRKKGLAIGAYFSKPDFHCEDYWEPEKCLKSETTCRPTYDVKANPEKWQSFICYTHKQIEELTSDYGKIDILWLDGGVCCANRGFEIKIEEAVKKARKINPELIVADRTAETEHENYITPELEIPERVLNTPWESCMTLGHSFQYVYDDDYKSPSEVINMLLEIVCKGGNLALNISPQPDGRLPKNAIKCVRVVGDWLKKYGEGIFCTRPCAPYKKDDVFFTEKDSFVYAFAKNFCGKIPYDGEISKLEVLNTGNPVAFSCSENCIKIDSEIKTDEEFVVFRIHK